MVENEGAKMQVLEICLDNNRIDGNYPKPGTKNYTRANFSDNVVLTVNQNQLTAAVVRFQSEILEPDNKLKVHGGYILGSDRGEFGGRVFFAPERDVDGVLLDLKSTSIPYEWRLRFKDSEFFGQTEGQYCLINENFKGFAEYGFRRFVFTGLAHMGFDEGSLYELIFENDTWVAVEILDLNRCPEVFIQEREKLYLATSNYLAELNFAGSKPTMKVLIEDVDWGGLYPNTIVYANNSLFVGMRGFAYEYNLKSGNARWYNYLSYDKESVKELEDKEWFLSRP